MDRYLAFSSFLRSKFGQRVQKIPLDAGFDCPNRDGLVSNEGCIFCNPSGSGSGLLKQGMNLGAQWEHWRARFSKRYKAKLFLAYLQSYSNTYGPASRLAQVLDQLDGLPGLAGISVGTRPDCVDPEKLELLAARLDNPGVDLVMLEMGLQSSSDDTLHTINRGHTVQQFVDAVQQAAPLGLNIVTHLVAGLPTPDGREGGDELLRSIRLINSLPVHGVKFHNTYVCRDTRLAAMYEAGDYEPPTMDEYVAWMGDAIAELRPDIVVHRLHGDAHGDELLGPEWAANGQKVRQAILDLLESKDIRQGMLYKE